MATTVSDSDAEKAHNGAEENVHFKTQEDSDNLLLDANAAHLDSRALGSLKLAKDGHTVLVPQPSSDPNDPLNWSWKKKHIMLFVVAFTGFLPDFTSAAGVPTIVVQGKEWNMSPNVVNYAGNLNVAMLGVGGLFWIPLASWWGRAPVLFWSTLLGAVFTLVCAVTNDFQVFYGFRALMGFSLVAFQVVGLACIKDIFFFHEHARKIGLWVVAFILSPYLSPLFANFILAGTGGNTLTDGNWRAVFWLAFGVVCLDLVLIVLFADETWYPRDRPSLPEQKTGSGNRIMKLLGIWSIKNREYFMPLGKCLKRLVVVLFKPIIIPSMMYYMFSFMWAVGINITSSILFETPVEAGGYGFLPLSVALLYFTPIVGALIGEFFGHFFNDFLAARYVRRHAGIFRPEARLPACYIAGVLMIPGLVLVGQTLQNHWTYGVVVLGWGMYVTGVMISSAAITTYVLDSYPTASSEVSGLLNLARSFGGFQVGYYQQEWGLAIGFDKSFGIQAAVVGVAVLIVIFLQVFGQKMRRTRKVE